MKLKFVFIFLLFCCFISQLEAQEDRIRKNQVGLVSSFLFYDSDPDLLFETECPLSFYYQRTLSPRVSLGLRMGFFINNDNNRNVYHLFSRVSVYSSAKLNAYIKPEVSYGQLKNVYSYHGNFNVESYFGSALDIGCRFTLKGRFNILFEKECFNYSTFQFTDDEDSHDYFIANSFLEGIRLGVEMGF